MKMRELTQEDIDFGDLIDIDEFVGSCVEGLFIDYDGFGYYVYNEDQLDEHNDVCPSIVLSTDIPDDVTHILWFNR